MNRQRKILNDIINIYICVDTEKKIQYNINDREPSIRYVRASSKIVLKRIKRKSQSYSFFFFFSTAK